MATNSSGGMGTESASSRDMSSSGVSRSSHESYEPIWDDEGEAGGDEAEEDNEVPYWMNKDSIIFLIDSHPDMFVPNDDGEVPFQMAVQCAIATLSDKIISSDSDLVGVCFYGTREKNNLHQTENIVLFHDLDAPDASRILDLDTLWRGDFEEDFGHSQGDFPLYEALWLCSTTFSNCTTKVGHKRIFLFTCQDNPNAGDTHVRKQNIQKAKDLRDLGIELELFAMNKAGHSFDPAAFYREAVFLDEDEDAGQFKLSVSRKFEELRRTVRKKEFKKRSLGRISFFIADEIEFAVRLYNNITETKKNSHTWLEHTTNAPIKTVSKWVCGDTGSLLLDSQIKYGFKYGGERVLFDKDEMQDMKVLDKQPGIRLMGFKPRDVLKDYYNIKHSSFIYPDERAIKGSIVVFSALLDRMLKMDKIAICRMTPRSNAQPRFVALLPQKEEIDRDGTQSSPPGFYVVLLPYTDDIRRLQIEKQPKANDDQIALAKAMVKQLRIKFDSRNFENPSLQQHYINLQALALEKRAEDIEVLEDFTLPDEDGMMKYAETIQKFTDSVLPAGYAPDPKKTPKKAKVPKKANTKKRIRDDEGDDASDDDTPNAKRKKEIDIDSIDWSHYVATGKISKCSVAELRAYLLAKNVKGAYKLKKAELVQEVIKQVAKEEEALLKQHSGSH